jgi:hypothetical protein
MSFSKNKGERRSGDGYHGGYWGFVCLSIPLQCCVLLLIPPAIGLVVDLYT